MTRARSLSTRLATALIGGGLWASVASSAWAQTLGQGGGTNLPWWRVIGALILCLGLAIGAAFALKTRLRGAGPVFSSAKRRLQLVETLRLSHQVDICLLTCDDQTLVVAATPQGAVFLNSKVPTPPPEAPE